MIRKKILPIIRFSPLFLTIITVPFISRLVFLQTEHGIASDLMHFWKDKTLWVLSFAALFTIRKSNPFIVLFLGTIFVSTLFSQNILVSIWGMSNYSEGAITFLCYCILYLSAQTFPPKLLNRALSISVCMMAFLVVLQLWYGEYTLFPPIHYLSGLTGMTTTTISYPLYASLDNPNHLGLFCALLFPIFLRMPNYYLSAILLSIAIGTESRGAWVAILLTMPWNRKSLLCLLAIPIFWKAIAHKMLITSSGRVMMWKGTLPLLTWFGKGVGTLVIDFPHKIIPVGLWPVGTVVDRPHNMILQMAHGFGVLSLIPLSALVYFAVRSDSIYRYGIISFLIAGLFTDSMVGCSPLFWIIMGVTTQLASQTTLLKTEQCTLPKETRTGRRYFGTDQH